LKSEELEDCVTNATWQYHAILPLWLNRKFLNVTVTITGGNGIGTDDSNRMPRGRSVKTVCWSSVALSQRSAASVTRLVITEVDGRRPWIICFWKLIRGGHRSFLLVSVMYVNRDVSLSSIQWRASKQHATVGA